MFIQPFKLGKKNGDKTGFPKLDSYFTVTSNNSILHSLNALVEYEIQSDLTNTELCHLLSLEHPKHQKSSEDSFLGN